MTTSAPFHITGAGKYGSHLAAAQLHYAFDRARTQRTMLAGMTFTRRLARDPRQAAVSLFTATLSRLPSATVTVSARTFWGDHMRVVLPEVVSSEILRFGYIEENLIVALLAHVPAAGTVFDVGAHFGFFSLLSSRLAGPEGRIVAFEPMPTTCSVLRRNVEAARVTMINIAVWNQPTELRMHDFGRSCLFDRRQIQQNCSIEEIVRNVCCCWIGPRRPRGPSI